MGVKINASGSFLTRLMSNLLSVTRTFTVAEMLALRATPIDVVRAPGASKAIIPIGIDVISKSTGHTPFAGGGDLNIGTSADVAILIINNNSVVNAVDTLSSQLQEAYLHTALGNLANRALQVTNDTAAFTGGTGTIITMTVWYLVQDV
jgi:hypothetical protein